MHKILQIKPEFIRNVKSKLFKGYQYENRI